MAIDHEYGVRSRIWGSITNMAFDHVYGDRSRIWRSITNMAFDHEHGVRSRIWRSIKNMAFDHVYGVRSRIWRSITNVEANTITDPVTRRCPGHGWVDGSILHGELIELFLVPASAPRLVQQRPWYVLFCRWNGAYKRTLAANRKE